MSKGCALIAADHAGVRSELQQLLGGQPDIEVVGEATDDREVLGKAKPLRPNAMLLDISMPERSGLKTVAKVDSIGLVVL
jgi:DNA-binding NarL/FixJ family response regulator